MIGLFNTKAYGIAHKFGDNINTDLISPAQYMELPIEEIVAHVMEGVDPSFVDKIRPGDIVVGGKNFGCGSSRETAPLALKGIGVSLIIAESFARIFYRNCINIGLPALICRRANQIKDGEPLEVDMARGFIRIVNNDTTLQCDAMPSNIIRLIEFGGLLSYLKYHIEKEERV